MTVHYAVINDFGLYADRNACCGNNFSRRKKLTDDPDKVTCRTCRELCGFPDAAAEYAELTEQVASELRFTIELQKPRRAA
jgi:hypothetical protein